MNGPVMIVVPDADMEQLQRILARCTGQPNGWLLIPESLTVTWPDDDNPEPVWLVDTLGKLTRSITP